MTRKEWINFRCRPIFQLIENKISLTQEQQEAIEFWEKEANILEEADLCFYCEGNSIRFCKECFQTGSQKFAVMDPKRKERLINFK
jgi:hypothetical protein